MNDEVCDFFRVSCSLPLARAAVIPVLKYRYWAVAFVKKLNDLFVDADENKRGMKDERLCGKQGIRNGSADQGYESEAAL